VSDAVDFWPPVPYTPPQLKGTKVPVVFWYKQNAESLREFGEAVDLIVKRTKRHIGELALAKARAALAEQYPDGPTGLDGDELADYWQVVEQIEAAEAAAPDVEPLGDDTEERARALGIVLRSVEVGGEERVYPRDHGQRVAFVQELLPAGVTGLITGILAQRTNEPGN